MKYTLATSLKKDIKSELRAKTASPYHFPDFIHDEIKYVSFTIKDYYIFEREDNGEKLPAVYYYDTAEYGLVASPSENVFEQISDIWDFIINHFLDGDISKISNIDGVLVDVKAVTSRSTGNDYYNVAFRDFFYSDDVLNLTAAEAKTPKPDVAGMAAEIH